MEKVDIAMLDFALLDKLYLGTREEALRAVISRYQEDCFCVLNFLYFANITHQRLVEGAPEEGQKIYLDALEQSDFLFADGIALQLFHRWFAPESTDRHIENINGTDFNPLLFETLLREHTVSAYLYQCYDPPKGKTIEFLQTGRDALQQRFLGMSVPRAGQCLFYEKGKDFDRDGLAAAVKKDTSEVKIFFNCTGTPFQEVWVQTHREKLRELGFLVINAGGTIDYLTGFEQRAPEWVVKARVLETFWRIITKPEKNLKKFLRMFGFFRIYAKKLLHLTSR